MRLLVAFGTDDGIHLNDDHVGMAKEFHVYEFTDEGQSLVERRENSKFAGDETMKHGDPEKAKATSAVLAGIDVLVGRKFGPNITRLLTKFACVVVRTWELSTAIEAVRANIESVAEQHGKGVDRKHIVLRP